MEEKNTDTAGAKGSRKTKNMSPELLLMVVRGFALAFIHAGLITGIFLLRARASLDWPSTEGYLIAALVVFFII